MKIKENLVGLVKSLTMSEKRYFNLFAARNSKGENNHYIKLFDLIDKTGSTEKRVIKKLYEDDDFMKNQFRSYKYRLYKQILKSLTSYY